MPYCVNQRVNRAEQQHEKEKFIDKIHNRNYLLINIALHLQSQFGTGASLNRAADYGSEGYRFEACRCHKEGKANAFPSVVYSRLQFAK